MDSAALFAVWGKYAYELRVPQQGGVTLLLCQLIFLQASQFVLEWGSMTAGCFCHSWVTLSYGTLQRLPIVPWIPSYCWLSRSGSWCAMHVSYSEGINLILNEGITARSIRRNSEDFASWGEMTLALDALELLCVWICTSCSLTR